MNRPATLPGTPSTPRRRRRIRWAHLNRRQTRVLVLSLVVAAVVVLFPPWVHEYHYEPVGRHQVFAGFNFLGAPPETPATYQLYATHLDYVMLLIEIAGVLGFGFGALLTMGDDLPVASTRHRSFR